MSVFSATFARDRLGRIYGLHLQTVESWGAHLLRHGNIFRFVLMPQPPRLPLLTLGNSGAPHTRSPPRADVLAFSIIVFTAREPRMSRHPKIPSILDTILRDSTEYFILVFSAQFSSLIFLFAVPVRDRPKTIIGCVLLTECACSGELPTHPRNVSPSPFSTPKRREWLGLTSTYAPQRKLSCGPGHGFTPHALFEESHHRTEGDVVS